MAPAASTASVVLATGALAQSIALAGHLDDGRVREKPIKDGGRRGDIAEKNTPVLRRAIRRDERGRGLGLARELACYVYG